MPPCMPHCSTLAAEPAFPPLTRREYACLRWIALGKTSWETGVILGLSERTVNFHVHNLCRKMGVHRRQSAIALALQTGLLPELPMTPMPDPDAFPNWRGNAPLGKRDAATETRRLG